MSSLKRFLHLEGRRQERGSAAPAEPSASGRFASLEHPADEASMEVPRAAATVARFERQVSDQPLVTDERALEEQPFLRCMHCQIDSSRYAQHCPQCGSSLTSPEQQEFNRALWQQRLQHREEEVRAQEAARKVTAEQMVELENAYRQLDTLREVRGDLPFGLWVIRQIKDPRWRIGVIASGLLGYAVLCVVALRGGWGARQLWLLVTIALSALFAPPSMRRRRRRWFDDY